MYNIYGIRGIIHAICKNARLKRGDASGKTYI